MAGGFSIFRFGGSLLVRPTSGTGTGRTRNKTRAKGSPPFKLLNAVTTTGDGTRVMDFQSGHSKWGLQVTHTGSPTGVVVDLYLTLNGTNWYNAGSWDSSTPQSSKDIVFVTDKVGVGAYLKLSTLSGGTAPTVSAWLCAW